MISSFDINKYILKQVKDGNINKECAFTLLKNLHNNSESIDDIAIIGLTGKLPGANNVNEYWSNIVGGMNCVKDFPETRRIDTDKLIDADLTDNGKDIYFQAGYLDEIDKFDAAFFRISPKEAALMDPNQRLLLEAAWEAIEDAGYGGDVLVGSNTGVFVGTDHSFRILIPSYSQISSDMEMLNMTGSWTSILASRISYTFNLKGPSVVIDTACSSGLVALHMACKALKNGDCDMAIAGGINLMLLPTKNSFFNSIESNDGFVRSFDRTASGTTWAEGVGMLMVKPLKKAIADRDSIYAIIKGSAINNDGASNGITAPNAQAQEEVIIKAWQEAQINPETISYIECHGTATVLGDPIEIKGLSDAFKRYTKKKQFCAIGTVKTNIAHTVSVSGVAAVIKMIKALENSRIPATQNFIEPNAYMNLVETPLYVSARPVEWPRSDIPRRAGISAFGLSGTNCHVVLEEPQKMEAFNDCINIYYVFTLSAKSEDSFIKLIQKYKDLLQSEKYTSLRDICYTACIGRGHYNYRLAIIAKDIEDLRSKLLELGDMYPLTSTSGDIFIGYHKLVPSNKKDKLENQISEREIQMLSNEANCFLQEYLKSKSNNNYILEKICQHYITGASIKWIELFDYCKAIRLHLPTYAFEHNRYWIDKPRKLKSNDTTSRLTQCYETNWKQEDLSDNLYDEDNIKEVIIIKNNDYKTKQIVERLKRDGIRVIEVNLADEFHKVSDDKFLIDVSEASCKELVNEVGKREYTKIIHMASITGHKEADTLDEMEEALKNGVYLLFFLTKALKESKIDRNIDMILVSEYCSEVTKNEPRLMPENASLFGLGKAVVIENSDIRCRCIDIDDECSPDLLIREMKQSHRDYGIAYRQDKRYVEVIREADLSAFKDNPIKIKDDCVYVITGGLSGIGLELAKFISKYKKVKFAMINRSALPERDSWDNIMSESQDQNLCKKLLSIKEIESNGSIVEAFDADISRVDQMERVVKNIKEKLGRIEGIFHCAGTTKKNILIKKDKKEFSEVLLPKVQGTWVLDKVTRNETPSFFVMFSSVSSLFGFPGQGDYTTANSYLDSYAEYRNKKGMRTLSINWSTWRDSGMAVDKNMNTEGTFKSIFSSEAMQMLNLIFSKAITRIVVGEINYTNVLFQGDFVKTIKLSPEIQMKLNKAKFKPENKYNEIRPKINKTQISIKGRKGSNYNDIEDKLARIWASVLGMNSIDIFDNFHDMGGDSIMASNLLKVVDEEYPEVISVTDLFSYPTIALMAEYIDRKTKTNKSNKQQENGKEDEMFSDESLRAMLKDIKNGGSLMEDALDILDKVRFGGDE